jgi:hypothetical protein
MRIIISAAVLLFCLPILGSAQMGIENLKPKKGSFYLTWGYNRAYFDKSDIHFVGEGFDFTLEDVSAEDGPSPYSNKVYLDPQQLTIPQFNFRLGYYFKENWALSLGWDHMKYKIYQDQVVKINGYIDPALSAEYGGTYDNENIAIDRKFLMFEHTNGFNFARIALERRVPIWSTWEGRVGLALNAGVSAGLLVPWTDMTFLGENYANWLHLSGGGVSALLGVRLELFQHLFIQYQAQYGYSWMPNIRIQNGASSRASQNIQFFERSVVVGGYIPIFTGKNKS